MTEPVLLMRPGGQEGVSYLKLYGMKNPWVQWALEHQPALAVASPRRSRGRRPRCSKCRRAMWYRNNGWECRREVPMKRIEPGMLLDKHRLYDEDGHPVDRASLEGKIVEVVYDRGKWRARPTV